MHYEYFLKQALKKNEIKAYLMGTGEYEEPETRNGNAGIDYTARFLYICEYQSNYKLNLDQQIITTVLEMLKGTVEEFMVGITYVMKIFNYLEKNNLKFDEKAFLIEVRKIVNFRQKELEQAVLQNSAFANMWEIVVYNNMVLKNDNGRSLI